MDFETLLRRHDALLAENEALKEENLSLKIQLGLAEPLERTPLTESAEQEVSLGEISSLVTATADPAEKIRLFMSLFKGREDLYAKRWESKDGAKAGYAPVCQNERIPGLCRKFEIKCASCDHRSYAPWMKRPSTAI